MGIPLALSPVCKMLHLDFAERILSWMNVYIHRYLEMDIHVLQHSKTATFKKIWASSTCINCYGFAMRTMLLSIYSNKWITSMVHMWNVIGWINLERQDNWLMLQEKIVPSIMQKHVYQKQRQKHSSNNALVVSVFVILGKIVTAYIYCILHFSHFKSLRVSKNKI